MDPDQYESAYSLVLSLFSKNAKAKKLFLLSALSQTMIGALGSYLYSSLLGASNQDDLIKQLLLLYLGQKTIEWALEASLSKLQQRAVLQVCDMFERDCLVWYQHCTSFESRETVDGQKFYHAVQDVSGNTVRGLSLWLVYQTMSVATTWFMAVFSFGIMYGWIQLASVAFLAATIKLVYLPKRSAAKEREVERQKVKERARGRLSFLLPSFTFGSVRTSRVQEQSRAIQEQRDGFNADTVGMMRIISLAMIICFGFLFFVEGETLMPALVSMTMLGAAINQLIECISHLSYAENQFQEFKDLVRKLEREQVMGTMELPLNWQLTMVEIPRKRSIVTLDNGHLPFEVQQGSSVLVRGSSGHGKSTLVKGITGQLAGCEIDYVDARVFRDSFVMVGQGAKHKLDFETLTLGELFETMDERLIEDLCNICLLTDWLDDMKRQHSKSSAKKTDGHPGSVLDALIYVSGGERNRLTLAYHLWLAEQRNARVLVLDECEQGTDVVSQSSCDVYELIRRIREAYHEMTLIVVSHFYDSQGQPIVTGARGIEWSAVITMSDMEGSIQ